MNTQRLRAGAGCVEIQHKGTTYLADESGTFTVPANIAGELVNLHVAAYVPDVAPIMAEPAPSNLYSASAFEGVTLDLSTVEARLLLVELESHARLGQQRFARFTDSAGVKHELTAGEISQVVAAARAKQFSAI
jgi:hypothetical protein